MSGARSRMLNGERERPTDTLDLPLAAREHKDASGDTDSPNVDSHAALALNV